MQTVTELSRRAAPGGRPQPLAFLEDTLWVGCRDTAHLYAIDTKTWATLESVPAPGEPYGIAPIGGKLRVVISEGDDDDRYLYTFEPGKGFDLKSKTPCPDLTGSHLASDGTTLYLTQMSFGRIVTLDANSEVARTIALPTRCAGIGFGSSAFYMISTDEEFDVLTLATLDVSLEKPEPVLLGTLPTEARSLAFDGSAWWTNLRDINEIASFTV